MPEDAHEEGKPCLIGSRHDLSRHISRCLFLSHGHRVRGARFCRHIHRALSSDRDPRSALSNNLIRGTFTWCHLRSESSVIEYVASALVVFYAAPATVPCRKPVKSVSPPVGTRNFRVLRSSELTPEELLRGGGAQGGSGLSPPNCIPNSGVQG